MIWIWGTSPISIRILKRLAGEPGAELGMIADRPFHPTDAVFANPGIRIARPGELSSSEITKVLIPSFYGVFLEKKIIRDLRAVTGCGPESFWILDEETLEWELASHGSVKSFLASSRIPYLAQLQYEAARHCNLKCKGCAHFTPLSGKGFGDLESFSRDLERIRALVDQIGEFRLLGGEPLLNEELYRFVQEARRLYPRAAITVLTNGIRLGALPERLLLTMRQSHAAFSVSLYPPVRNYVRLQIEKLRKEGILFREIIEADTFVAHMNIQGDSDGRAAERKCAASICHTFEDGRIYKCPTSMRICVYEDHFCPKGTFPICALDLYDKDLTAGKLFEFLMEPIELCAFCGEPRPYAWERAGKNPRPEDWYGNGKICE